MKNAITGGGGGGGGAKWEWLHINQMFSQSACGLLSSFVHSSYCIFMFSYLYT